MSTAMTTNYAALLASQNLENVQRNMDKSINRLSSGLRINSASDDAAGIQVAGRMETQIRGLTTAMMNSKNAQSLVNTAEGAMIEVTEVLQRMRELAVQSSSGIATTNDRNFLDAEMEQLVMEIDSIAANTKFNGKTLLKGNTFKFYHDIYPSAHNIQTNSNDMSTSSLAVTNQNVSIGSQALAKIAISRIDTAINSVVEKRANLGAISNRIDHVVDNLTNVIMNTTASKSRIEDADYATETTELTKNTVLQQAATAMLSQANASKNTILTLIQT